MAIDDIEENYEFYRERYIKMAKNEVTAKEIITFIKSKGGREVTKEDKKTDWYKLASKKPSCFKSKAIHKSSKA